MPDGLTVLNGRITGELSAFAETYGVPITFFLRRRKS